MKTDIERWEKLSKSEDNPSWHKRNDIIAKLIPEGSSVLDVGAGNRDLQRKLNAPSAYQAVDCVGDAEHTVILDFNDLESGEVTLPFRYDIAVCSGVLEYLVDARVLLRFVTSNADFTILTYVFVENRITANDTVNGWVPGLSRVQLTSIFKEFDIKIVDEHRYSSHTIMLLKKAGTESPWDNQ